MIGLPGVTTPTGISCATVLDPGSDTSAWTNSFQNIQCYAACAQTACTDVTPAKRKFVSAEGFTPERCANCVQNSAATTAKVQPGYRLTVGQSKFAFFLGFSSWRCAKCVPDFARGCGGVPRSFFPVLVTNTEKTSFTESLALHQNLLILKRRPIV